MKICDEDTIVATATPPGKAGVGIVRISGTLCARIAHSILGGLPAPRKACLRNFRTQKNGIIDQGIAIYYMAPHSFTGQDILELQAHGSPLILSQLISEAMYLKARPAQPGEFSKRAFLNGRYDLLQLEAVADIINCDNEKALRCAQQALQGKLSQELRIFGDAMKHLRVLLEASIDFAEEDLDSLKMGNICDKLHAFIRQCDAWIHRFEQGVNLCIERSVAIIGEANVGKSTLLNCLVNEQRAITSEYPGTTRDVVSGTALLSGQQFTLLDTAGLRSTQDPVEHQGMQRSVDTARRADFILLVVDASQNLDAKEAFERVHPWVKDTLEKGQMLVVFNKVDKLDEASKQTLSKQMVSCPVVLVSAKTQCNIDQLKEHILALGDLPDQSENLITARSRHVQAITAAGKHLRDVVRQLDVKEKDGMFIDLAAESLRYAQQAVASIHGEYTTEALLDDIFKNFCIGK